MAPRLALDAAGAAPRAAVTFPARCSSCESPFVLEIDELHDRREFNIRACCAATEQEALSWLADPDDAFTLLTTLGVDELTGLSLRRVLAPAGHLELDWDIQVQPILRSGPGLRQRDARAFIKRHHRHAPAVNAV